MTATIGRRARVRARTTDEILGAARRRLAAEGAPGVSLRAIARDLGMGVSSLYRYFPSRDDLLTELLVEAFDAQADAVDAAVTAQDDPVEALRHGLRAYRRWSLEHPPEFALAYGTPVPGYRAPADRTIESGVRVGGTLIGLLDRACRAGRIDAGGVADREASLSPVERDGLDALISRRGYRVSAGLMSLSLDLFVRVQGFVVMEAFGQLRPLVADPATAFERTIDTCLAELGVT